MSDNVGQIKENNENKENNQSNISKYTNEIRF